MLRLCFFFHLMYIYFLPYCLSVITRFEDPIFRRKWWFTVQQHPVLRGLNASGSQCHTFLLSSPVFKWRDCGRWLSLPNVPHWLGIFKSYCISSVYMWGCVPAWHTWRSGDSFQEPVPFFYWALQSWVPVSGAPADLVSHLGECISRAWGFGAAPVFGWWKTLQNSTWFH